MYKNKCLRYCLFPSLSLVTIQIFATVASYLVSTITSNVVYTTLCLSLFRLHISFDGNVNNIFHFHPQGVLFTPNLTYPQTLQVPNSPESASLSVMVKKITKLHLLLFRPWLPTSEMVVASKVADD